MGGAGDLDDSAAAFCTGLRPRLLGSLTLLTQDPHLAEELAQDTFVRVWERWPEVRSMDHPEAWAFRVAFNLGRSRLRRGGAERRANRRALSGVAAVVELPDSPTLLTVRSAVARLPDRQRAAIVARFYLQLDVAATAEVLGCQPGTVKALTHQGLQNLRKNGLADVEAKEDLDA